MFVRSAAGSWWFRIVFTFVLMALIQPWFAAKLFFTGDEPHYLLSTLSFLHDGDFNLRNNYELQHYREFGYTAGLNPQPQFGKTLKDELIPAEHGTIYPVFIAPAYALAGEMGVRWFQIMFAFLGCLLIGGAVDLLTGNRLIGSLSTVLLALSPTWQMQASRIYPDIFIGASAALIIFFLARQAARPDRRPAAYEGLAMGFLIVLMPVMYVKYGVLAAPLALTAFSLRAFRMRPWLYAGALVAFLVAALNLYFYGDQGALG
ncbi:MAG: hypothetical protein H7Y20_17970, partial [Bryobacteraceae bacterium]|nr:hypothetical protein [Bryobacteraceae bacterium]